MDRELVLLAVLLGLAPLGVVVGLVLAWRLGGSVGMFVGFGAVGGLLGGLLATGLSVMVPGDTRGFGLLGVHALGAMLGAVAGVLVGSARRAWHLLRGRARPHDTG